MATKKAVKKVVKAEPTTKKSAPKKSAPKNAGTKESASKTKKKVADENFPKVDKVEKHGEGYEVYRSNDTGGFKHEIVPENPLSENEAD